MREDNSNWFGRWEEELPPPEELMPLSQTLITPHLALAFHLHPHHPSTPPPPDFVGGEEQPRTLKRPRLVWTPQLHKRFVDAVAHLGIKNAVPKTIMQLMSVEGLTRENVASHLQKYRLYLRRMQGNAAVRGVHVSDPATDHLFASSPVPAHLLGSPQKYHPQANSFSPSHSRLEHQIHGRQRQQYEDSESGNGNGGRKKILTLFPTGND